MAYPYTLDTFTTKIDHVDTVLAAHINLPQSSIVAIEAAVGFEPNAIAENVAAGATPATLAEYADMVATQLKAIIGPHWYTTVPVSLTTIADRQWLAGAGLTGGGPVAGGDITLGVGAGDGIQVDDDAVTVKLDGTTLSKSAAGLKVADGAFAAAAVQLIAGAGLEGGGTLSQDRTIALQTPGTLGAASINQAAGNHTHAITTSSAPGAAASILATDGAGMVTLVGATLGTVQISAGVIAATGALAISPAAGLTLSPVTGLTLQPGSGLAAPNTTLSVDLGSLQKKFRTLHVGTLVAETLVEFQTATTMNGRLLLGVSTSLIADVAAGATSIDVASNALENGDHVVLEVSGVIEFMTVTSSATAITGGWRYTVTRDVAAAHSPDPTWSAGAVVFNTGHEVGDGWLDLFSRYGMRAGQTGPAIVVNARNSGTYNDWIEHVALGNLAGLYGYGADTFGLAVGKYSTTSSWLGVDATYGVRVMRGATQLARWDVDGNITLGRVEPGQSNVYITSGAVKLRNDTTDVITLLATANAAGQIATFDGVIGISSAGGIWQGSAGTFAAPNTGLKIYQSSGKGVWEAWSGAAKQVYIDPADMSLRAAGGLVRTDDNGISIVSPDNAYANPSAYKFIDSGDTVVYGGLYGFQKTGFGAYNLVAIESFAMSGKHSQAILVSNALATQWATTRISANAADSPTVTLELQSSGGGGGASLTGGQLDVPDLKSYGGINVGTATSAGTGDIKASGSIRASTALGARVYNDADITLTTGTLTALTFNQERFDSDTIHSTSSNTSRLTATTAGVYVITGTARFATNATGNRRVLIRLNGATYIAEQTQAAVSGLQTTLTVATIYTLAATDYVELVALQSSGGDLAVTVSANISPEFSMTRVA